MLNFWPIYKRETRAYFQSPSTYVVLALFFFFMGLLFQDAMFSLSNMSISSGMNNPYGGQMNQTPNITELLRGMFGALTFFVMFTVPMLSMRLVAEEKSRGTFELLVTCPVGDWAILLGKYFALLTVGLFIVVLSSAFPLIAYLSGHANGSLPEIKIVVSCWTALFLIYASYAAFGLMASAFTENQIAACVITLIGLLMWNVMGMFQVEGWPLLRTILTEMTASQHTDNFIKGVLMLKDFAFYILASFTFLFIASKTLDARRWRI
jgi:ABC-2 type transport system permease protein